MTDSGKRDDFDQYAHDYKELHRQNLAASGEDPEYFSRYKVAWLATRHRQPPGTQLDILDFGCGVGGSIPFWKEYFPTARIHGRDESPESVRVADALYPDTDIRTITSDGLDLPDESIDLAMAACVFHHIPPRERELWARNIFRSIRKGAYFSIFEHNPRNPLTRKTVRDCPFDEHAILLPAREARTLLEHAGFRDVRIDYVVFFPRFLSLLRPFEKFLAWLPVGAQYVASGLKPDTQ